MAKSGEFLSSPGTRSLRDPREVAEDARILDELIQRDPVRKRALLDAQAQVRATGANRSS